LKFRGAASTGFRAPSLVDEYSPQVLGAGASFNISNACLSGNYTPVFSALNCSNQSMVVSGGNPNLKPETSQNFDLGMIVSPLKALNFTVDYYRIIVRNEISSIPELAIFNNPTAFASAYTLNSSGTLTPAAAANIQCPTVSAPTCGYITLTSQNTGFLATDGVDLSADYTLKTSYGKFRFGLEGTYVMAADVQLYTGGPTLSTDGRFNQGVQPNIRWQDLLTLDWTNQQWGAGLSNHYLSKYQDQSPNAAGDAVDVGAYSIWNGYVSFKPTPSLKVLLGVNNLFNTNPPFSNQTANWQAGYNPLFSNPLGRTIFLNGTYKF
jgi:iron complex outermembrane receptor protein